MLTKVPDARLRWHSALQQVCRGLRHEHLAAMANGQKPRDAVDGRTEIITVAFFRGSGVDRHAHAYAAYRGEIFCAQRPLRVDSSRRRILRSREGDTKGIAHGFEHRATMARRGSAQELVMA